MIRIFTRRTITLLIVGGALIVTSYPLDAVAQEVRQRRGLLDWIFGGQKRQQQPDVIQLPTRKKKPKTKKRSTSKSVTTVTTKEAQPAPKNGDARHVLVIGDFLASGLAEGLEEAFAEDPTTVIDSRTNPASGLVRDDYYNWPQNLTASIGELKPAAVLVMLGSNDRQQMQIGDVKEKFDTPAWNEAYVARVQTLLKIASDSRTPLVWVGLPAFKSGQTSGAALQFNAVYRNEAARAGAEFVDIWDGFVDENGKFIVTGSDMNGQPVRLRTSDGVGMTAAGKRKMAFYAEKPLRKILGDPLTVEKLIRLDSEGLLAQPADKEAGPLVRTPPISLTDPELDGGGALLGENRTVTAKSAVPALPVKAPAGRVDDFSIVPAL
jgi:hypothetical protein